MTKAVESEGGDSAITYAEIHSELEEVQRILVDLTGTVERLSAIVASVSPRRGADPTPTTTPTPATSPVPAIPASSPPAGPNPVDAILGETFGRPT